MASADKITAIRSAISQASATAHALKTLRACISAAQGAPNQSSADTATLIAGIDVVTSDLATHEGSIESTLATFQAVLNALGQPVVQVPQLGSDPRISLPAS